MVGVYSDSQRSRETKRVWEKGQRGTEKAQLRSAVQDRGNFSQYTGRQCMCVNESEMERARY